MKATKLEINEDIIKKKLLINEPEKELETLFPAASSFTSVMIKPKPGLCVKTKNTKTSEKVFINVCTANEVPAPEDISNQELIAIFESSDPSDFKIPMSIGQPHEELDKGGSPCMVYDVVINPTFFDKMSNDPLFNNFFMIITCEALEEKYNTFLDKNSWTMLKNKKFLGKIPEQNIRSQFPLVQELSGIKQWKADDFPSKAVLPKKEKPASLITEITTKKLDPPKAKKKPKFSIEQISNYGERKPVLLMEINLPDVVNGQDIEVDLGEDRVVVESEKNFLDEPLPHTLDGNSSKAFFIKESKILVLFLAMINAR